MYGILAVIFVVLAAGCLLHTKKATPENTASKQLFAMDTVITLRADGKHAEEAVEKAVEELLRLDKMFSTGEENSEISMLNRQGEGEVSEETLTVLEEGMRLYKETGGLFDMTIYPLMQLWGFTNKEYHVPSEEELEKVLPLIGGERIQITGNHVTLGEDQQIDLGGIAKGYASARLMEIYKECGVTGGMVSLGGNVQALGTKPDGKKWKIGIQDPEGENGQIAAVLEIQDLAVITAGGYERYFEEDGNTYIHIMNPKTGYPADGDLASVTVVSAQGMAADALSTALYLMGYEKACDFWRQHAGEFGMILIDRDGKIFVTEDISADFSSERETMILKK